MGRPPARSSLPELLIRGKNVERRHLRSTPHDGLMARASSTRETCPVVPASPSRWSSRARRAHRLQIPNCRPRANRVNSGRRPSSAAIHRVPTLYLGILPAPEVLVSIHARIVLRTPHSAPRLVGVTSRILQTHDSTGPIRLNPGDMWGPCRRALGWGRRKSGVPVSQTRSPGSSSGPSPALTHHPWRSACSLA